MCISVYFWICKNGIFGDLMCQNLKWFTTFYAICVVTSNCFWNVMQNQLFGFRMKLINA
jgi:hypothetical protein